LPRVTITFCAASSESLGVFVLLMFIALLRTIQR